MSSLALVARNIYTTFDPNIVAAIGYITVWVLITVAVLSTAFYIVFLIVKVSQKDKTTKECFVTTFSLVCVSPLKWPYYLYKYMRSFSNRNVQHEDIELGTPEHRPSSETCEPILPAGFTSQRLHSQPAPIRCMSVDSLDMSDFSLIDPGDIPGPRPAVRPFSRHSTATTGQGSGYVSPQTDSPIGRPQSNEECPVSPVYALSPTPPCVAKKYFEQEINRIGGENPDYFAAGKPSEERECISEGEWIKVNSREPFKVEQVEELDMVFVNLSL